MEIKFGCLDEQKEISDSEILRHRFVLSSDAIDRDFEQVLVKGIQLKNFKENPMMYWMHKTWDGIPIGLWDDLKVEKRGDKNFLLGTTDYNMENEDAQMVSKFVEAGYLRMASIGFIALANEKIDPPEEFAEVVRNWTYDGKMRVIKKSELTEASIVGIGSNPDALKEKFTKGLLKNISESDMLWYKEKTFDSKREFIFLNHKKIEKIQERLFDEPLILPDTKIRTPNEIKQGAVLNKKNKARLQTIIDNAMEIMKETETEEEPVNYLKVDEIEYKQDKTDEIKIYNEEEIYSILNKIIN